MPWITDCGCTSTSIAGSGRANSRAASITSRPLFIRVAESMLILAPIDQTGCLQRRLRRDGAPSRSRVAVRNGPPEAVSTIVSTAPRLPSASDWKMALCSESTGSRVAPASATARSITSPAQTSASLLASATAPPRRIAASVGGQAGGAGDRRHGPVGRQRRGLDHRGGAGGGAHAAAGQRLSQVPRSAAGSLITASSAPSASACSASSAALRPATRARTRNRPGGAAASRSTVWVPTLPVLPSRVTVRGGVECAFIATALPQVRAHSASSAAAGSTASSRVQPVEQAAMAGDQPTGVLHAEAALGPGSRPDRRAWPSTDSPAATAAHGRARACPGCRAASRAARDREPDAGRADQPAGRAGPGLARGDRRRQPRPADQPPGQIGADVARPDQQHQEADRFARPASGSARSQSSAAGGEQRSSRPRPRRGLAMPGRAGTAAAHSIASRRSGGDDQRPGTPCRRTRSPASASGASTSAETSPQAQIASSARGRRLSAGRAPNRRSRCA